MSKLTQSYETKLENANSNEIVAILDSKLSATSPQSVVDYVGFSLDNLDATIERIRQAEKDLKALRQQAEIQKDIIKIGASTWLTESGVDSLKGDIESSMKVTTPKPTEELIITNEEALINQGYFKTVLDKTAVKHAIQDGAEVEGAHIDVTHKESSLTVYKKRAS